MKTLPSLSWIAISLVVVMLCGQQVCAETVTAKVSYVSASEVYLDVGRSQGLATGDTVQVERDGKNIAALVIAFVSDKTASCKIVSKAEAIRAGDQAVVVKSLATPVETKVDTTPVNQPTIAAAPAPVVHAPSAMTARLTGRVSVALSGEKSRDDFKYDYYEPALVMRTSVENLFGSWYRLSINARVRKDVRTHKQTDATNSQWYNRLYEVSLSYDAPKSVVGWGIGRILSNSLAGIGYLDGAQVQFRTSEVTRIGAFGGTEPDLQNTDFHTNVTKGGVFATYERLSGGGRSLAGTVALAGEYNKSTVSREFVYEQVSSVLSPEWNLFESGEVNINRGWRKKAEGSSASLSNIMASLRWNPVKFFSANAGYDNRKPYHTFDTRSVPDSLFDSAIQQGFRLGFDARTDDGLWFSAFGTMRTEQHVSTPAEASSLDLSWRSPQLRSLMVGALYTTYSNRYARGNQPSLRISYGPLPTVQTMLQGGTDVYTLKSPSQKFTDTFARLNADWTITRTLYSSASYEVTRGKPYQGDRYYVELGCRF